MSLRRTVRLPVMCSASSFSLWLRRGDLADYVAHDFRHLAMSPVSTYGTDLRL